jgi:hypothetical protein
MVQDAEHRVRSAGIVNQPFAAGADVITGL